MDFFTKLDKNIYEVLSWNTPEQKQGTIYIYGGNSQSFNAEAKLAETLKKSQAKIIKNIFPDTLKKILPETNDFIFVPSTESGSIATSDQLLETAKDADFNLVIGDFSKNSITANAITKLCENTSVPTLIARDAIDLISTNNLENLLQNDNLILFASTAQLQKILHAVYYPKVVTLSQPVMQVAEILHKFTISYSATLVILNNGQILVAKDGDITSIPLEITHYQMLTIWSQELLAKIATANLFNPNNIKSATISAFF